MRYFVDSADGGISWYIMDSNVWSIVRGPYANKVYAMNMCRLMNEDEEEGSLERRY